MIPTPIPGADPEWEAGDFVKSKQGQAAIMGTLYYAANAARPFAVYADFAADAVPVVGEVWLGAQGIYALYQGGKTWNAVTTQCDGG